MTATPVGFHDGLGERRQSAGAGTQQLDLLVVHEQLGAAAGFDSSLRERVNEIAPFQHQSFPRIRGVGHAAKAPARIVVATDHVPGVRLSEVLAVAERRLIPLEYEAALGLLHQIVRAVAAMHEALPQLSHGALAPERLIVTPEQRVVVTDHVFGAALQQLHFSPERLWKDLRVAVPPSTGSARFDRRTDVTQVGAVALALLLGRPLRDDEYPGRVSEIVEGVRAVSANGLEMLPAKIKSWLCRALQLDARRSFATAIEAQSEFETATTVDERRWHDAIAAFLSQYRASVSAGAPRVDSAAEAATPAARIEPAPPAAVAPVIPSAAADPSAPPAVAAVDAKLSLTPGPSASPASPTAVDPVAARSPFADEEEDLLDDDEDETDDGDEDFEDEEIPSRGIRWRPGLAASAAVLVALATVGVFAARGYVRGPATGTLTVNTNPPGVEASVNGERKGTTPLTIELEAGEHMLQLASDGQVRAIPVKITAGRELAQFLELPKAAPALGHLNIRTEPAGAVVTVDGERRGVSPLLVSDLTPGLHRVVLENALGSVTEQVTIEAGATAALVVPLGAPQGAPVSGWVSVNAPQEMQIFERGRLLGTSRSDRIMMSVGRHELQIANEALGYRVTRIVQVGPGRVTPVRVDPPKGSLSLNASPWAEVWVDGERVGETPIGSLPLAIGEHSVLFRHPELGEQHHTVTVTLAGPARVSADMRKP